MYLAVSDYLYPPQSSIFASPGRNMILSLTSFLSDLSGASEKNTLPLMQIANWGILQNFSLDLYIKILIKSHDARLYLETY